MNKFKELIENYKISLEVAGVNAKNYLDFNKSFWQFCESRDIALETITLKDLNLFLHICKEKNSNRTIATKINGLRSFYKYLFDHGIVTEEVKNLTYKLKIPKFENKLRDFFTKEEFDQLIRFCDVSDRFSCVKIRAILTLMFYSGLRKNEVVALKRSNFDFEKGVLGFKNFKSKKNKFIPLLPKVIATFKEYFDSEEEETNAFNMNMGALEDLFIELNSWQIIDKHITPHLFRHSFAHYALSRGMSLEDLKELLGHSDIKTTMIYSTKTQEEVRDSYLKKMK